MTSTLGSLVALRREWKDARRRVVFTNGCFDILHTGHVALLEAARVEGDVLVVGINSDRSVRALKGEGRPAIPEAERAETLLGLEAVDRVLVYDEETPVGVIRALLPDVLVKGADWGADAIVGSDVVEEAGGKVVRVALVPGKSTSALVHRIPRP